MHDPCNTPEPDTGYRGLIKTLSGDDWTTAYARERPQVQTARLVCPNQLLHMTVEQNTVAGTISVRLGILPGGSGEPARWRAYGFAASPALWCEAARAAARARDAAQRPSYHPAAAIPRPGWVYSEYRRDGRVVEDYTSLATNRRLTYQHATRDAPALWTITRPKTSIEIAVTASEPYALPALVLALIDQPEPTMPMT